MVTVSSLLITHERLARWARQLRPRLASLPIDLVETRSRQDLLLAVARHPAPLLLVDLGQRPIAMLDDLEQAMAAAPDARTIVLDPERIPDVPRLARQLGATEILSGPVPPPLVADRLARWHTLNTDRLPHDGWIRPLTRHDTILDVGPDATAASPASP